MVNDPEQIGTSPNVYDEVLAEKPEIDYITFSGAGEPMLHAGITDMSAVSGVRDGSTT